MIQNESAMFDRIGITPRLPNDSTSADAAAAVHAYSPAGQNDYAAALGRIDSSLPAGFAPADQLFNDHAMQLGMPEGLRALQTGMPEGRMPEGLRPLQTGMPEGLRALPAAAPESIAAPATTATEATSTSVAAAPESIVAPATTAPESIGAPATAATSIEATSAAATAATSLESMSSTALVATDATSASATAAPTPEQAAIAAATVQLTTPVVTVGPNGELTESQNAGTGFIVNGDNGQQYIVTAGHVPAATGQDGVNGENGQTTYAEGPTQVTFADGTQTTATVVANNTSITTDNSVQLAGNPDIAVLSIPYSGPTLPYPALQLAPNAQPSPGDTLTSVGYPSGDTTPTAISSTYLGMVSPSQIANNSSDTTPMLDTSGAGVHGMSGAPVVDSNGDVVGVYTEGTPNNTLDTPISNASNLIDGLTPFSPNYFYNLFNATPQPIATPDDRGNGSDQTLYGITLNSGGSTTHLDAPSTTPAPASAPPEVAPATPPATDAPPAVTPPPIDTPPVATPPAIDAPPVATPPAIDTPPVATPPAIDTPPVATPPAIDTPPVATPPAIDAPPIGGDFGGGDFGGGDFGGGGGGGDDEDF
jgi:hypothetical protein